MKIIDFRCRPRTKAWLEWLKMPFQKEHVARVSAASGGIPSSVQTPADLIREMDDAGVTIGVMSGRDVETTLGWKWENEEIADFASRYPDRLIGFAGIDPNKRMQAVREVDKAARLGLKGAAMDPFMSKTRINDKKMYPIYAKCVEHGFPVYLCCGHSPMGAEWEPMSWCQFMDVDDVATDFPELTIVCSHTSFPWVWEGLAICTRHPNVILETSSIDSYCKMLGAAEPFYLAANSILGNQFVFASTKPYVAIKPALEAFKKEPYREDVKQKILWDNPARILKLL